VQKPPLIRSRVLLVAVLMLVGVGNVYAAKVKKLPRFDVVAKTVDRHFAGLDYYEDGDLIGREDVAEVLDQLATMGWAVPRRAELEKRVLAEKSFLVRQLRTKRGVPFMRKVANMPQAYDRLDRLSAMSGGRRLIVDLIKGKGGEELIEYMSTTTGGANLGKMLANTKGGSNMNKPTGRIYTVDALVKELKLRYAQTIQSATK